MFRSFNLHIFSKSLENHLICVSFRNTRALLQEFSFLFFLWCCNWISQDLHYPRDTKSHYSYWRGAPFSVLWHVWIFGFVGTTSPRPKRTNSTSTKNTSEKKHLLQQLIAPNKHAQKTKSTEVINLTETNASSNSNLRETSFIENTPSTGNL